MFFFKVIAIALLGALITMIVGRFRESFDPFRYRRIGFFTYQRPERSTERNKLSFYICCGIVYIIFGIMAIKSDYYVFRWYLGAFCSGSAVFFAKYLIEDYMK